MRRTYRSKKESGNALDHRDVIQNLDEKTSVFNAFYIQKIKQAKRELSCVGSTNHYSAANKVRKRKYVKRIVKEAEAPSDSMRESISQSAFLTPDKSIRVNKPQDLFDQLLNSPSSRPTESPVNSKVESRVERKPYFNKRNISKIKKFNCSSSGSHDSDKENSNEASLNDTDIRTHELLIEKQKSSTTKHLDESIKNIVKKISILKNYRLSSPSFNDSTNKNHNLYQDHRLTTNLPSPDLSKSPLCSTPFKEKYRSRSIYNFSPIGIEKNENSQNSPIIEESANHDSLNIEKEKEPLAAAEPPSSPIIHLSVNKSGKSDRSNKSTSKFDHKLDLKTDLMPSISKDPENSVFKNDKVVSIEMSVLEPFLGFSNLDDVGPSMVNLVHESSGCHEIEEIKADNSFIFKSGSSQNKSNLTSHKNSNSDAKSNEDNMSSESEDLSYDTCASDESLPNLPDRRLKVPVVKVERLDNSLLIKYYTKLLNDYERYSTDTESDDYASLEGMDSDEISNHSINKGVDDENISEVYIEHEISCIKNDLNENNISKEDINNSFEILANDQIDNNNVSHILEESNLSNIADCSVHDEEERCISFVTTRRRNEVTNDSIILGFNSSMNSTCSAECDKTVLSNNDLSLKEDLSSSLEIANVVNLIESQNNDVDSFKFMSINDNVKLISQRSTNIPRDSCVESCTITSSFDSTKGEVKPAIVLQPGKKWERSLSIYRRMTMMTDDLNHSMLEDEQLQSKGRKYRQSVINTMEMQDSKGLLHNESIIGRRSTFVSKPSRSTIRIIREPSSSRLSLCTSTVYEDLKGM